MTTKKQPGRTKKTVTKSPVNITVRKYREAYDKNFGKLLEENSSKIRTARENSKNGRGGVEMIEKLADRAARQTDKQLGYTNLEAIERHHQKKEANPKYQAYKKAKATMQKYKKGSYKK